MINEPSGSQAIHWFTGAVRPWKAQGPVFPVRGALRQTRAPRARRQYFRRSQLRGYSPADSGAPATRGEAAPAAPALQPSVFLLPAVAGRRTMFTMVRETHMAWLRIFLALVLFLGPLTWPGPVSACPS